MMVAEVVRYRSSQAGAFLTIAVDQFHVDVHVLPTAEGYAIRVGQRESPPYQSEAEAVVAACQYAERMVLGAGDQRRLTGL